MGSNRFVVTLVAALAAAVSVASGLAGCAADDPEAAGPGSVEVLVDGLAGPTQLAVGPDGQWWLAELNGGENDTTGRVVRMNPVLSAGDPVEPVVLVEDLDKPTGVAVFGDQLWIMERNRLTRGPLDGTDRTVVVDGLVNNGRSEGSLTIDGDRLLFDTSGRIADGAVTDGSGVLWAVTADGTVTPVASGFKHAYAQVRAADGTLFTTEIADGRYDGVIPDDELVAVHESADHGWPRCVGDNVAVAEYGGDADSCADVPRSHALFAPGATPTSVVVAPWDPDRLVVALWNAGIVVTVPVIGLADGGAPVEVVELTAVSAELEHPQHLVVVDDGEGGERLLVTDHTAGTIVALNGS